MQALERWIEERVRGRRVAVVGVGNRLRGDDAAGPRVIDLLGKGGGWTVYDAGTVPENFLVPLVELAPDVVLFVDAFDHGGAPGAWCAGGSDALAAREANTHAPSIRLLTGLLRRHHAECWLIGIQPQGTALGAAISARAAAGVTTVARALAAVRGRTAGTTPVDQRRDPSLEASRA